MTDPKAQSKVRPQAALIWCPFPDRDSARKAANTLLEEDIVGCANLLGDVESIFKWQGQIQASDEVGVLLKTRTDLLERVIERIGVLHPYDAPAILGLHCDAAHTITEKWLATLQPQ